MEGKIESIIVSRHPAAVDFLRQAAPQLFADAPVVASATAADVRGRIVGGNLPMWLANEAEWVGAIEFSGAPPRGAEYTAEDMIAAGAELRWYRVRRVMSGPVDWR